MKLRGSSQKEYDRLQGFEESHQSEHCLRDELPAQHYKHTQLSEWKPDLSPQTIPHKERRRKRED